MKNLYKNKLGDNFKIIQDSNKVDISKLDPSMVIKEIIKNI